MKRKLFCAVCVMALACALQADVVFTEQFDNASTFLDVHGWHYEGGTAQGVVHSSTYGDYAYTATEAGTNAVVVYVGYDTTIPVADFDKMMWLQNYYTVPETVYTEPGSVSVAVKIQSAGQTGRTGTWYIAKETFTSSTEISDSVTASSPVTGAVVAGGWDTFTFNFNADKAYWNEGLTARGNELSSDLAGTVIGWGFFIDAANDGSGTRFDEIAIQTIPEPATLGLLGIGGILGILRRRK